MNNSYDWSKRSSNNRWVNQISLSKGKNLFNPSSFSSVNRSTPYSPYVSQVRGRLLTGVVCDSNSLETAFTPCKTMILKSNDGLNSSCLCSNIEDQESILIGAGYNQKLWLHCDYFNLCTREQITKWNKTIIDSWNDYINNWNGFNNFSAEDKELYRIGFFAYNAVIISKSILGDPTEDLNTRLSSFNKYSTNGINLVKPISHTKGMAACSEYSALCHFLLNSFGIENKFINGEVLSDEISEFHSYLVIGSENKVFFDPVRTSLVNNCFPPKLYLSKIPFNLYSDDWFECKNFYSSNIMFYGV